MKGIEKVGEHLIAMMIDKGFVIRVIGRKPYQIKLDERRGKQQQKKDKGGCLFRFECDLEERRRQHKVVNFAVKNTPKVNRRIMQHFRRLL